MEKRNTIEPNRTPCKRNGLRKSLAPYCDCDECLRKDLSKRASDKFVDINDIEALARIHE